jgi:hypothetical protein
MGENSGSYCWVVEDLIVLGFQGMSLGRLVRRHCGVIVSAFIFRVKLTILKKT